MRVSRRFILTAIASVIIPGVIGCSTFSTSDSNGQGSALNRIPWFSKKDQPPEPYPSPVKLVATWTPDTLIQTGRTPTRGFGGRVYFFNEKSRAVPVEGTLVVHGFDEHAGDPESQVKRFAFTPEQFTQHFSQSDLGASYSVWIPWDAAGGENRKISLVATFMTKEGKTVQGPPTTVLLPGDRPDPEQQLADKLSPDFRRWQQVSGGDASRASGLTTTTIPRRKRPNPSRSADVLESAASGSGRSLTSGGNATPSAEVRTAIRPSPKAVLPTSHSGEGRPK